MGRLHDGTFSDVHPVDDGPDVPRADVRLTMDSDDLVAVSRTAYDDYEGGAHSAHDANFLTFHRIKNFRTLRTSGER